jgi:hypothetical protein
MLTRRNDSEQRALLIKLQIAASIIRIITAISNFFRHFILVRGRSSARNKNHIQ